MTAADEGLASWIRALSLSDQLFVTGATLLLADIKARNIGRFEELDERLLRETNDPWQVRRTALEYVSRYGPEASESDDDGNRVVTLCRGIVERIDQHFPESGL